jgi:hypothetical protein
VHTQLENIRLFFEHSGIKIKSQISTSKVKFFLKRALYQSFLVTLTPLNLLCRENENKASFTFYISLDFSKTVTEKINIFEY